MQELLAMLCLFCALSAHAAGSDKTVRRLRVENYPELPPNVAAVLQSRRCTIPQPNQDGPARNVIQGEFFRKGQKGWAVLCSSRGKSSILVPLWWTLVEPWNPPELRIGTPIPCDVGVFRASRSGGSSR